jgi:hypothetical protein
VAEPMPVDKHNFAIVSESGYLALAADEALSVTKPLADLDVADVGLLLDKIKLNREMLSYFGQIRQIQRKGVKDLNAQGHAVGIVGKTLRLLGIGLVPGARSLTARGGQMLHAYSDTGKMLIFDAEDGYESARKALEERISQYQQRLAKIEASYR